MSESTPTPKSSVSSQVPSSGDTPEGATPEGATPEGATPEVAATEVVPKEVSPTSERKPPRKPILLGILTVLLFVGFTAAFYWNSAVEDAYGIPLDVTNLIALVAYLAISAVWVLWIAIFSRWEWSTRSMAILAIILVPSTAVMVLNPVFGGDMTIVGWQPPWAELPVVPEADEIASSDMANLEPESEGDFAQFLGPQRNGVVQTTLPLDPSLLTEDSIQWKIPVGPSWSGFVARNGFAVTMEQRQEKECVTCYRIADGELLWMYQHDARHQDSMAMGHVGPRSTPVIHQGRVYAIGAVGNVVCLDGADGALVWQVDLNSLLGLTLKETGGGEFVTVAEKDSTLEWGRSGSPLVYEDCLIVPGGGPQGGPFTTLFAFDLQSGKVKWTSGNEMIGYGSPSLQTVNGIPQILMMAESKGMSFDPSTGKVLWTWDRPGDSSGMANTSQMSVVNDDQVLMSKGYPDGGGTLIQVTHSEGDWDTKLIWNSPRVLKTKLTSPILKDGYAYSICNGFLECAALADGDRIWKHRGRLGHGQLLLLNDLLIAQSEFGELMVTPASPDGYQELAKLKTVDGICWNTLCLADDKLLVRSDQEAACILLPTK